MLPAPTPPNGKEIMDSAGPVNFRGYSTLCGAPGLGAFACEVTSAPGACAGDPSPVATATDSRNRLRFGPECPFISVLSMIVVGRPRDKATVADTKRAQDKW